MRMTGNRFLLDTNIIAAWLKGAEPIADKTDRAVEVYIPIIMLGEIYYWTLHSTKVQKNMAILRI